MYKTIIAQSVYDRIIAAEKAKPTSQQSVLYKVLCQYDKLLINPAENENYTLHPDKVLKRPSALYILDVPETVTAKIQSDYGVMCLSGDNPDITPLIDIYDEHTTNTREPYDRGWHKVLDSIKHIPSNALILTDRYLFKNTNNWYGNGFSNFRSILSELLPTQLKTPYHITVVFFKDGINDSYSFESIAKRLYDIALEFKDPSDIMVEALCLIDKKGVYHHLHNRRIVSNYYVVKTDYTLAAFDKAVGTSEQTIIPQVLFTEESLKKQSSPPLMAQQQIITALSNFSKSLSYPDMEHDSYLYAANGMRLDNCQTLRNRLLK